MKPDNYPRSPAHLWQHFYRISQIPRPSRAEEAVRGYAIDCAREAGCECQTDGAGNLLVRVPASPELAGCEPLIVQNHLDMVTVKTGDTEHDFRRDPLQLQVVDGWLQARGTTLGADNGVGCAAALALMTDPAVRRPPLELLFTVDEETGLGGALNLDGGMLHGTRMLNLDTEEWEQLYIGCAGGAGWRFRREYTTQPGGEDFWEVTLTGLAGGHSGVQIHEQLGNAIKLLGQFLYPIEGAQLALFDAGVAHNAIPREARAVFACPAGGAGELRRRLQSLREQWLAYLPPADAGLDLALAPAQPLPVLNPADSSAVLRLIAALPHGAQAYSLAQPADLVDLSINLAILRLAAGELYLESSYRFFNTAQSEPLQQTVLGIAAVFGLAVEPDPGYPGWEPDFDSPLLRRAIDLHRELFGREPAVKAIHAGLECGILKDKKPDLDILSFGPTIRGAHSPTERLRIDSVEPFWRFLNQLLASV